MNTVSRWMVLVLAVVLTACASQPGNGPAPRDRTRITEAELAALPNDLNAYDIVQRLRPFWFNVRAERTIVGGGPAEVLAYQGEMRLGGIENLRNIRGSDIVRIEYLDASQAVARLPSIGNSRPAGAIIVRLRVAS